MPQKGAFARRGVLQHYKNKNEHISCPWELFSVSAVLFNIVKMGFEGNTASLEQIERLDVAVVAGATIATAFLNP